ncbi:MAG: permease prefix domain 1-containing protein [Candidatus Acidiferrum sp.]
MSLLRSLLRELRSPFRKEQASKELNEELNGFLEMAAEEKVQRGMSRKEASGTALTLQDDFDFVFLFLVPHPCGSGSRKGGSFVSQLLSKAAKLRVCPVR